MIGAPPGDSWTARNATRGTVVASRLRVARRPLARLRGLLGRPPLDAGEGLWIAPCRQVHSFGMRCPLDLLFVGRDGRVVRVLPGFRPWRFSPWVRGAEAVVELPAGSVERSGTRPGDELLVEPGPAPGSRSRAER